MGENGYPEVNVGEGGVSVKLRGLPFKALEQDISEFFNGYNVQRALLKRYPDGRPNGEVNAATLFDAYAWDYHRMGRVMCPRSYVSAATHVAMSLGCQVLTCICSRNKSKPWHLQQHSSAGNCRLLWCSEVPRRPRERV